MAFPEWRLSLKLVDQPSLPKSVLQFPESEPGDVPPGGYRVATLKQLVSAQLPDAVPDPDLIGLQVVCVQLHTTMIMLWDATASLSEVSLKYILLCYNYHL